MKRSLKIVLVLICLIFISSCKKKYPNGPYFNFHSKDNRLMVSWGLKEFIVDGQEQIETMYFSKCELGINEDKIFELKWNEVTSYPTLNQKGGWDWIDDKKSLNFDFQTWFYEVQSNGTIISGKNPSTKQFRILKLTSDELWLKETTSISPSIELHFKSLYTN